MHAHCADKDLSDHLSRREYTGDNPAANRIFKRVETGEQEWSRLRWVSLENRLTLPSYQLFNLGQQRAIALDRHIKSIWNTP